MTMFGEIFNPEQVAGIQFTATEALTTGYALNPGWLEEGMQRKLYEELSLAFTGERPFTAFDYRKDYLQLPEFAARFVRALGFWAREATGLAPRQIGINAQSPGYKGVGHFDENTTLSLTTAVWLPSMTEVYRPNVDGIPKFSDDGEPINTHKLQIPPRSLVGLAGPNIASIACWHRLSNPSPKAVRYSIALGLK